MKNWRKKDRWKRTMLKPLGLCIYCMLPYISLPFFLIFITNIYFYPLFIGMSYIWLKLINKL